MAPSRLERQRIARDTIDRTPFVLTSTLGSSAESVFYNEVTCPPLDQSSRPDPPYGASSVSVINSDSFTAARNIFSQSGKDQQGKVAVLNLASDEVPGGGWLHSLSKTQEEALCYSSTLYRTLRPEWYPWPNLGPGSVAGIYSPGVVVFKDDLDNDCVDLPVSERIVVSVITVAAPRGPELTPDKTAFKNPSDVHDLRGKIRLILRMAARDGRTMLVLGAMGCGAYQCPPLFIAQEIKSILLENEFKGWFKKVVFAVYSSVSNGPSNFETFSDCYRGLEINN